MKTGTQNHMKTKRLAKRLAMPLYRVVGLLETLWLLCQDCADEGNIGKFSDDEICEYIEWDGPQSASELIEILVEAGWLDRDPEYRLVVHDWQDHAPEFIKERLKKRGQRARKSAKSASSDQQSTTYDDSSGDTSGTTRDNAGQAGDEPPNVPSLPSQAKPSPSKPNPAKPVEQAEAAGLISLVGEAGVSQAKTIVLDCLRRSITPEQIRGAVTDFQSRTDDVGPGLLHRMLGDLRPGQRPKRKSTNRRQELQPMRRPAV